jgi:hypothetical protein
MVTMKTIFIILAILAALVPASAYDQAEFDAFSAGVLSADAPDATLDVAGDMLIISEPGDTTDYIYTDSPISHAERLVRAANHITDNFPGEFRTIEASILNQNDTPIAIVILNLTAMEN